MEHQETTETLEAIFAKHHKNSKGRTPITLKKMLDELDALNRVELWDDCARRLANKPLN